jgi:hypothetical protein
LEATTKEIIKGYLEKAKRKLEVAEKLFNPADYEDWVSRAYYAVFHATQALLFFAFPSLFQSGGSPLFIFLTESMDHKKCESVFIYPVRKPRHL